MTDYLILVAVVKIRALSVMAVQTAFVLVLVQIHVTEIRIGDLIVYKMTAIFTIGTHNRLLEALFEGKSQELSRA